MTFAEKKQLQKMIKALPRENLDRVAELVKRGKQGDEKSDDDIHVDLEKEVREEHMDTLYIVLFVYSNFCCTLLLQNIATLWRLYYYVKAIEKARKLTL